MVLIAQDVRVLHFSISNKKYVKYVQMVLHLIIIPTSVYTKSSILFFHKVQSTIAVAQSPMTPQLKIAQKKSPSSMVKNVLSANCQPISVFKVQLAHCATMGFNSVQSKRAVYKTNTLINTLFHLQKTIQTKSEQTIMLVLPHLQILSTKIL